MQLGSSAEHSEKWRLEPRGSAGQESRVGLVRRGAIGRLLIQASALSFVFTMPLALLTLRGQHKSVGI